MFATGKKQSDQLDENLTTGETSIYVGRCAASPMLAAQFGHGQTVLNLTQHAHDLGFGEAAPTHRILLVHLAKKILLPIPLNQGEDYHCAHFYILWIIIISFE